MLLDRNGTGKTWLKKQICTILQLNRNSLVRAFHEKPRFEIVQLALRFETSLDQRISA